MVALLIHNNYYSGPAYNTFFISCDCVIHKCIRGSDQTPANVLMVVESMHDCTYRYANEILVQYNIQCGANQLAFFNVTSVNLQSADCNGRYVCISASFCQRYVINICYCRCVDYVEVDRGVFGVTESCGTDTTNNQIQLERSVYILMRCV